MAKSENSAQSTPRVSEIQATDSTCTGCSPKSIAPAQAAPLWRNNRRRITNTSSTHPMCSTTLPR